MRSIREFVLAVALIGFTYVVSYIALSLSGRYEAILHSAGWVAVGRGSEPRRLDVALPIGV